jgi:hypothetical protein
MDHPSAEGWGQYVPDAITPSWGIDPISRGRPAGAAALAHLSSTPIAAAAAAADDDEKLRARAHSRKAHHAHTS